MADKPQVVKLAQPGIDVKTAGDENLVYNSNWPLLKIYKQGSFFTNNTNDANQLITTHDLGYVPMFWYFSNHDMRDWTYSSGPNLLADRSEFTGPTASFYPATDNQAFWFEINPGFLSNSVKFYYYIFALDILTPYTAPVIKSGGVIGPRNTKTVFKIAKSDKDISSQNLEDYVVNSNARSPMLHAVVPFTNGTSDFKYAHNLGYIPMFFAYARPGLGIGTISPKPDSYIQWYTAGADSGFRADEQTITFDHHNVNPGVKFSLVVLKDPFNISNPISVTI